MKNLTVSHNSIKQSLLSSLINSRDEENQRYNNIKASLLNNASVFPVNEKFDIESFNSKYEIRSGRKPKLFVETLIDDISTDNKKNKHKITLIFNDKEYTDSKEITNIKSELTKSEYEIILDYDSKGYINKITIE